MKINGDLVLNALGESEIKNLVIERVGSAPTALSSEAGRIIYNTSDNTYYFNNGTGYVAFATGGNAASIQTEVNAIETSLGAAVNTDGTFNASALNGNNIVSATSVTNAINQLDAALQANNTLAELDDVNTAGLATGSYLKYNGASWVPDTLTLSDVTDVTATAAELNVLHSSTAVTADFNKLAAVTADASELNILDGATLSTVELNYVDGVTSGIQGQLDGKQPLDAQLTSVASLTPALNDVLVGKADGTYELKSGASFAASQGLTIGTNVQAFDADLSQLAGFAPADSQFLVGTGGVEGARWVLEDGATVRTSLGLGDIATMDDSQFIKTDGTSTVTANIPMNGHQFTGLASPTVDANAATKGYVDALVTGLSWKNSVVAASTGDIDLATGGLLTVDGVTVVDGNRVLVKDQTTASQNGIYVAHTSAWTRAADADAAVELSNAALFVQSGTLYADTAWTQIATVTAVGTSPVNFSQFSGGSVISPGTGLSQAGNVLNINLGAGIKELASDNVGVDLYNVTTGALILTTNGSARDISDGGSAGNNAQLHLLTHTAQLEQDANGLYIVGSAITAQELAASVAGNGLTGGAGTALAVVSTTGTSGSVGTLVVTADAVGVALGNTDITAAPGNHVHAASAVTFTPAGTIAATNTQAAIEEVSGDVTGLTTTVGDLQTEVNAIETGTGLNNDGTYTAISGAYFATGSTLKAAVTNLDTQAETERVARVAVNTRLTDSYHLYTSVAPATSHAVTHGIGKKFCNVTVVDASDEVIIPQSIKFDSTTQLTVTFNTSIDCKVVVMAVN
jgi:hypothetical protein